MNGPWLNWARKLQRRLSRLAFKPGRPPQPGEAMGGEDPSHRHERQSLAGLLAELGYQNPMEPLFMLEAFLSTENHLTPRAFAGHLKARGRPVKAAKSLEALELFHQLGFADKRFGEDGLPVYEHRHPNRRHDHLVCLRCGCIQEFTNPAVDKRIERIAASEGFSHLGRHLVIQGLCPVCRRERGLKIRLTEATVGETLVVIGLDGPPELHQRLQELGLSHGRELTVLGENHGASVILVNGVRLALGLELATHVLVRDQGWRSEDDAPSPPLRPQNETPRE